MARSLKDKLNGIVAAPAQMEAQGGLIERVHEEPAPAALMALQGRALPRLGLNHPLQLERAVFLDAETTGLGGGAPSLFWWGWARFVVEL